MPLQVARSFLQQHRPLLFLRQVRQTRDSRPHVELRSAEDVGHGSCFFTHSTPSVRCRCLWLSKTGTTFTRYFPDKKFGGGKQSLDAAEKTLAELKSLIEGSKLVEGKLSPATVKKANKLLFEAV